MCFSPGKKKWNDRKKKKKKNNSSHGANAHLASCSISFKRPTRARENLSSGAAQKRCADVFPLWNLDELSTWARNMVTWYWSADTLFWQVVRRYKLFISFLLPIKWFLHNFQDGKHGLTRRLLYFLDLYSIFQKFRKIILYVLYSTFIKSIRNSKDYTCSS